MPIGLWRGNCRHFASRKLCGLTVVIALLFPLTLLGCGTMGRSRHGNQDHAPPFNGGKGTGDTGTQSPGKAAESDSRCEVLSDPDLVAALATQPRAGTSVVIRIEVDGPADTPPQIISCIVPN